MSSDRPVQFNANDVDPVRIHNTAGDVIFTIHADGTVTGDVENASEAAAIFVAEVRRLMAGPDDLPREKALISKDGRLIAPEAGWYRVSATVSGMKDTSVTVFGLKGEPLG